MPKPVVATQLPPQYQRHFEENVPDCDWLPVPMGVPQVPPGVEILIAAGSLRQSDGRFRDAPPGWPHDLRWTQLITVGLDFYPDWFLAGPPATSGRGNASVALAEFCLASIFAQAKRHAAIWIASATHWKRHELDMIQGKTLGIVGFGGIGRALAPRAQALGMRVMAVRRSATPMAPDVDCAPSLEALFAASDYLVLTAPATPETRHMINARVLEHARPGLHLINVARGSLIDNDALLPAIASGRLSRATLDVTDPEPLPDGHPFYAHPNIDISAHCATNTPDNIRTIAEHFGRNLERFRHGEPLHDVVNGH